MRTKAALVYEYKKPLVIDELTLEAPRDREVLIQYRAAGLCHSDVSVRDGVFRMPPPALRSRTRRSRCRSGCGTWSNVG